MPLEIAKSNAVVLKSVTVLPLARINTDKRSTIGGGHDPLLKMAQETVDHKSVPG